MYGGYGNSMYGGMGMMGGRMGMMNPMMMGQMGGGFFGAMQQFGQMSEILGMNAEALQYAIGSFGAFVERIGGTAREALMFFVGQPLQPPINPQTGQPLIDPQTGQPFPMPTPEEQKAERKKRFVRLMAGLLILFLGYKAIRYWLKRSRSNSKLAAMNEQWDTMNGGGAMVNSMNGMNGMNSMYGMGMGMGGMMGGMGYGGMGGMGGYGGYGGYGSGMYGGGYGSSMYGSGYGNSMMGGYGSSAYGNSMYGNSRYGNSNLLTNQGGMSELDDIFG